MRRALKWAAATAAALAALAAIVLALVIFGGRDPDLGGTVLLRWDRERGALEVLQRPRMALDGPYVFRDARGYRVLDTVPANGGWRLRERRLPAEPRPTVAVCSDGAHAGCFDVPLRPPARPASADHPRNPPRLLMLSDFEGQFDRFVELLRAHGVIDADLHWRYGRNHIALAGDFVDRGPHVLPLLWLIYRLEDEAARAGGRVHYILGNHEQKLLRGDMESWPERMRATAQRSAGGSRALFSQASVLGQWLRSKPVIARVGDHLLVHGGVSAEFLRADLSVDAANAIARAHLETRRILLPAAARPVLGRAGVTGYRGLAKRDERREADVPAHLRAIARRYGVRRLAIGHTIAPEIALEHDGLLLRLDVHHASRTPQAALYEYGALWRVYADGRRVRLDCAPKPGVDDATGRAADRIADRCRQRIGGDAGLRAERTGRPRRGQRPPRLRRLGQSASAPLARGAAGQCDPADPAGGLHQQGQRLGHGDGDRGDGPAARRPVRRVRADVERFGFHSAGDAAARRRHAGVRLRQGADPDRVQGRLLGVLPRRRA